MTASSLHAGLQGFATYDCEKESEVPRLVVTARDTDVRRRPAACVDAADIDSDADVVLDAPAVSEVPVVPTQPTATDVWLELKKYTWDVAQESPQSCHATVVWTQEAVCASGSAGSDPSILAETSRASPLTADRRRTRRDRCCMAEGVVQMVPSCPEHKVRILHTSSHRHSHFLGSIFFSSLHCETCSFVTMRSKRAPIHWSWMFL